MPTIGVPVGQDKLKLLLVMDRGSIGSPKMAVMTVLIGTPVAFASGTVELTVGAVVSVDAPVVNDHTKLPARDMPLVSVDAAVTVTVHIVLGGRLVEGKVRVATLPVATKLTTPVTGVPAGQAREKLAEVKVAGFIALLKAATMVCVFVFTSVALASGATGITVGATGMAAAD